MSKAPSLGIRRSSPQALGGRMPVRSVPRAAVCALVLGIGLGCFSCAFSPKACAEAKVKTPAERTLDGEVKAKGGAPLPHAVVYLQDSKSMIIRSYVADDAGHYHFRQLSPDTDYDVWAELNGHRSKTRTISQFNSHAQFHFALKLKS